MPRGMAPTVPEGSPKLRLRPYGWIGAGGAALVVAMLVCSGSVAAGSVAPSAAPGTISGGPATAHSFPTPIRHVFVIMLENEEASNVLANASYEASLASKYAYANEFYSPMHYSLPNYLAATSGYATNYFAPVKTVTVGSLAQQAGLSWKEYEESMPAPCDLSTNLTQSPAYDYWHNPFAMYKPFISQRANCVKHMVNFTQFDSDLAVGNLPNYGFIVPNITDDGHNTGLGWADQWLAGWLPNLLGAPVFASSAIFVLYDEGTSNLGINGTVGGGHIYLTLVSPYARMGYRSPVNYSTFDLLTTTEWLLGLGHTGNNDSWTQHPPMRDLFSFPQTVSGTVTNAAGSPLAVVRVRSSDHVSTWTNATGAFSLTLPQGNWTISVALKGGLKGSLSVTVQGAPLSNLVLVVRERRRADDARAPPVRA